MIKNNSVPVEPIKTTFPLASIRFLSKFNKRLIPIPVENVAFFYAKLKATFVVTFDERRFVIDENLEKVEQRVIPSQFFRINRSTIISYKSIKEIFIDEDQLRIVLHQSVFDKPLYVSRTRGTIFKKWLKGIT
ncbi:MAG TPA: LytTR family DNA-binding domain-containing protein [Flavisolibacter sp.]|nr:LytTR family DNA-binding domain-containing protein [Flavisolibacter sp.]